MPCSFMLSLVSSPPGSAPSVPQRLIIKFHQFYLSNGSPTTLHCLLLSLRKGICSNIGVLLPRPPSGGCRNVSHTQPNPDLRPPLPHSTMVNPRDYLQKDPGKRAPWCPGGAEPRSADGLDNPTVPSETLVDAESIGVEAPTTTVPAVPSGDDPSPAERPRPGMRGLPGLDPQPASYDRSRINPSSGALDHQRTPMSPRTGPGLVLDAGNLVPSGFGGNTALPANIPDFSNAQSPEYTHLEPTFPGHRHILPAPPAQGSSMVHGLPNKPPDACRPRNADFRLSNNPLGGAIRVAPGLVRRGGTTPDGNKECSRPRWRDLTGACSYIHTRVCSRRMTTSTNSTSHYVARPQLYPYRGPPPGQGLHMKTATTTITRAR